MISNIIFKIKFKCKTEIPNSQLKSNSFIHTSPTHKSNLTRSLNTIIILKSNYAKLRNQTLNSKSKIFTNTHSEFNSKMKIANKFVNQTQKSISKIKLTCQNQNHSNTKSNSQIDLKVKLGNQPQTKSHSKIKLAQSLNSKHTQMSK